MGHLTFSCQAIGGEFGLSAWLPSDHAEKFDTGSVPYADATAYLNKTASRQLLSDPQARITTVVL